MKTMPRDKQLAEVQIMAALAIAIMLVGAQIAAIGPGVLVVTGWIVMVAGVGLLGWNFYKLAKI